MEDWQFRQAVDAIQKLLELVGVTWLQELPVVLMRGEVERSNCLSLDGKGDQHRDLRDLDQGPRRVPGGSLNAMIHGLA